MAKDKWLKISTIRFDSRSSGIYCFRCNRVTPFRDCPACGEKSTISSIMMREKAPPSIIQVASSAFLKAVIFPFSILLKALRVVFIALVFPLKIILTVLRYPFIKISETSERIKFSKEEEKKFRSESEKWSEIFYQRNPGWIGSGFPARALYELECAAEKGNHYALLSLEKIFKSENGVNKARAAQHLKKLTGKDYMSPLEIDIKIRAANTIKYPLPPAPDDLP